MSQLQGMRRPYDKPAAAGAAGLCAPSSKCGLRERGTAAILMWGVLGPDSRVGVVVPQPRCAIWHTDGPPRDTQRRHVAPPQVPDSVRNSAWGRHILGTVAGHRDMGLAAAEAASAVAAVSVD